MSSGLLSSFLSEEAVELLVKKTGNIPMNKEDEQHITLAATNLGKQLTKNDHSIAWGRLANVAPKALTY